MAELTTPGTDVEFPCEANSDDLIRVSHPLIDVGQVWVSVEQAGERCLVMLTPAVALMLGNVLHDAARAVTNRSDS